MTNSELQALLKELPDDLPVFTKFRAASPWDKRAEPLVYWHRNDEGKVFEILII